MSIETIISKKTVEELVAPTLETAVEANEPMDENIELVLKCLKYQNGCDDTENNKGFIGLGDMQIAKKAGISLERLYEIKAAREARIIELNKPVIEE